MAADMFGGYRAEAVQCHACAARDKADENFDGPKHGIYFEIDRKGDPTHG